MEQKPYPIPFNKPMALATIEGRKTHTRRICFLKFWDRQPDAIFPDGSGKGFIAWWGPGPHTAEKTARLYPGEDGFKCPYGQPGDRLYGREAWRPIYRGTSMEPGHERIIQFCADGYEIKVPSEHFAWFDARVEARGFQRRPSIHMPRWASRILLEIVAVRVERLNDITAEDCLHEGIDLPVPAGCDVGDFPDGFENWSANDKEEYFSDRSRTMYFVMCADHDNHIAEYKNLWETINGPGSWAANPWVWVIEFKRI